MTDVSPRAERYQVAGEGKDLFSRIELRERIRDGSLMAATEIAREGSDSFRPAVDYPELARYFSLVTNAPGMAAPSSLVAPSFVPASSVAPPTSVGARLLPGLIYPLTGFGAVIVFALALFKLLPFGALATLVAIPLVNVAVVRVSSEGSTRMPALAAFGGPGTIVITALKAIAISLLSAWPFVLAVLLAFVIPGAAFTLGIAAAITMVLYYPACLAILAKYGTIRPALSVSEIWGFISTLGADYALAIAAGFGMLGLGFAVTLVADELPERVAALAIGMISVWGVLYVFHLIGWAMYRHRSEL